MRCLARCAILIGLSSSSLAETWTVDDDGPADFSTIQEAIAAANQGDTIEIAGGSYGESDLFIADADITLIGAVNPDGSPAVKIDGQSTQNILLGIGLAAATGATVENLIFTGSTGNALWIYHHAPTIRNCTFVENSSEFQGTAVWTSSTEAVFESCRFIGNTATDNGNVVHIKGVTGFQGEDHGNPVFRDCLFENNSGSSIVLAVFWDARFERCTFHDNTAASILQSHQGNLALLNTQLCENEGDPIMGDWTDEGGNFIGEICPTDCVGDFNGDQIVGVDDLLTVLESFQINGQGDCDDDGDTDVDDVLILINSWGNCE